VAEELVVGTVVGVDEHAGARAPSLLLTLDLGAYGTHEVVLPSGTYQASELRGTQIVCRRDGEGAIVVGAHSHGSGFILLRPDREIEPGAIVS
jgi:hypothetical protein